MGDAKGTSGTGGGIVTPDGWTIRPAGARAASGGGRARTADGRPRADRARQFMPFAALRGYYDLIREQQRVPEPRRDLADEDVERISRHLAGLAKGDMVRIRHYDRDAYVDTEGVVARMDPVERTVTVVRQQIAFDDILYVEKINPDDL